MAPHAIELSGELAGQSRVFTSQGATVNSQLTLSASASSKLFYQWDRGNTKQSITLAPFVRIDSEDSQRSHLDLREFFWELITGISEIRIGFCKLFWGVTESPTFGRYHQSNRPRRIARRRRKTGPTDD